MRLKLEIEGVMLNVVSGYAPQGGCELEGKERFWSELDEVIGADFNGHAGEVMGKFGVKERNLEGQMVVDFAKRMDMVVLNTYFQKREEHRVTYKSGEAPLSMVKLVSSVVAASPYLLVTIILGVKCYKARGLCAVSADTATEKVLKVGSSLDLTVTYPKNSVSFVQWNFNGKTFAEYTPGRNYTLQGSQFSGRLKVARDLIGVTLQDLQPQDSGTFSIVAVRSETQHPTQFIKVYIQNPIRAVQIERTQRWLLSTNSCEVDVKCAAHGAENVSYLWSGYKIANGAQLQFNLSPAEGAITLNCTAANNISSSSATETLSCSTEQPETDDSAAADGNTLYAEVTPGAFTKKDTAQTIYAKVTLPQHAKASATSSSPYQQVL
ncbi:hypothetical protein QTP86_007812 [Hemibagrus guttatus]|nr:hypothetical protein QTP86_007812 [Hemibagrus guttatus]